jgi:hypothetical protein
MPFSKTGFRFSPCLRASVVGFAFGFPPCSSVTSVVKALGRGSATLVDSVGTFHYGIFIFCGICL